MSTPQLPAGLPPLPDGAVYLGMGGSFVADLRFTGWGATDDGLEWVHDNGYIGNVRSVHYAAPADSEIARLNGHGVEPAKPAADSEAVALVRKLRDELVFTINDSIKYPQLVIPQHQCNRIERMIRDANAFLAKEETKS